MCQVLQTGIDVIKKWVRYFKMGRILLQSGSGISKWDEYFYKVYQVVLTGTNITTKWVKYFKLGGILLQSGSGILNWEEYYYKVRQAYQKL